MALLERGSLEIGQALLSAPFDAQGWDGALRKMAHHTASAHGELIGFGSAHSVSFNWTTDASPDFFSEFIEIGGGDPRLNWRVANSGAPFDIRSEADYVRVRRTNPRQYAAYDEFADRHDMMNGCQTVLLNEQGTFFGLAVLRTHADGPTTEANRQAFAEVAPFALSAVRLQHALERQGALMVAGALDQMKAAAIICDGGGRVCALTPLAEEWLRRSCRLVVRDGRILAARADENKLLGEAIKRALGGGAERGAIARFWLRGEAAHLDSEICEVFSLPTQEWSFGFRPRVLIVVRWPTSTAGEGRDLVQGMWGLTSAETSVAVLLAQGMSREQIAASRNTSPVTVHSQLKSLFRKLDVTRESELVALLRNVMR